MIENNFFFKKHTFNKIIAQPQYNIKKVPFFLKKKNIKKVPQATENSIQRH